MSRLRFKKNSSQLLMPEHEPPRLHEDVMTMSFENFSLIRKFYKDIIGLRKISHFSINIVDPNDLMSIISLNPNIAYNICADGSYLYNGSISPSYYKKRNTYSWDECYDTRFSEKLKNNMERKNGIEKGIVIIRRHRDFTFLYSFATKFDKIGFTSDIYENLNDFYNMGDHCLSLIKPIYMKYDRGFDFPDFEGFSTIENSTDRVFPSSINRPKLKVIRGGKVE